ncbi:carbon-nitrogen hydrolase family protein [bacterium]|nr:carbon-nitrogen hydrolase family protein [bacterium]
MIRAFLLSLCVAATSWAGTTVRVAAVQCYSHMGKTDYNRELLTRLVAAAAKRGAKIVVLPECAVSGYMDPGRGRVWSSKAEEAGEVAVQDVAETISGPSTRHFGEVARKHGIYLVVPLIEESEGKFYNAQVLMGPDGKQLLHHRKQHLWPPGDATWATRGEDRADVVDTPYGRLGLMICYECHTMPRKLAAAGAQIVLYSVGWYGPNTETWYTDIFPERYVKRHGFAVVSANWSADPKAPGWEGIGYSAVFGVGGTILAMTKLERGATLVIADVPVPAKAAAEKR